MELRLAHCSCDLARGECLFVCLFYSYTVPSSREGMRKIIYSDVPCHLFTIKARKWWSFNFKSSQTIFWFIRYKSSKTISLIKNFCRMWSFHICLDRLVSDLRRFVVFVSSNDLCRLQNDQVFCQMISKRSCLLKSNFLNFFSRLKFLFRAQLVHAKVTLSSDREYYKKDVMMIDENDQ